MKILEFLKDTNDAFSMTRLTIFALVSTYMIQSSYIVIKAGNIPDFPTAVAGLLIGLYGFNKSNINIGTKI